MTTNEQIEQGTIATMPRQRLVGLLSAVLPTASKDPTRPHLHGVLLETKPRDVLVRAVSTDGHRLTRIDTAADFPAADASETAHLLPRDSVEALVKTLRGNKRTNEQPITIALVDGSLIFHDWVSGQSQIVRPTDDNFPPYAKVIPAKDRKASIGESIGLNPHYLADVAKVARFAASEKSQGVKVNMGGDRDPVRIDMDNGEASAVVVIMPMRI